MEINQRIVCENDISEVIEMLQDISKFRPEQSQLKRIFEDFIKQENVYGYVYLFEGKIVGYGSIVFETKIRGGKVGHIEDIVVKKDFRNKKIGFKIIDHLTNECKNRNCYKVSLVCKEHNVRFYENCGLLVDGVSMSSIFSNQNDN